MLKRIIMSLFNFFSSKKEKTVEKAESIVVNDTNKEKIQIKNDIIAPAISKFLTDKSFNDIAKEFNLNPAHIRAIYEVEAGGKSGFLKADNTKPVTLEEGHVFYKYAKKKGLNVQDLCNKYPTICYPKWTKKYYKSGLAEYARYELAKSVNEECAMLATSWGIGQIMGFNYQQCGYKNVKDFVNDMYLSEEKQLRAMCMFIKSNTRMFNALKAEDWATFASLYNGSGYELNKYDVKLKIAYNKYKDSATV